MRPLYVAIVGSGPAGFYSAAGLLALEEFDIHVDMLERLPTPWGLVRSGVAPDHPEIKSVSKVFAKIAGHPRYRYFGNIEVGRHLQRSDLTSRYDAVIYAVGAQHDRRLGLPGEDLPGCLSAAQVVGWYNGHPDHRNVPVDRLLSARRAVVVGNGNVALDVARIVSTPPAQLSSTDIADHALAALTLSEIRSVVILGRRGPLQANFTPPELRELGTIDDLHIDVDPRELDEISEEELAAADSTAQRNFEILQSLASQRKDTHTSRTIALRFHRSPVRLSGDPRVREVVLARNTLHHDIKSGTTAYDTGERERIAAGLVITAVGYQGTPISGLPFDRHRGIIPNDEGRIRGTDGEYVVGWIKRGPSGVIGTNKKCAQRTIQILTTDLSNRTLQPRHPGYAEDLSRWLATQQPNVVMEEHWRAIDAHERRQGERLGRPRVKVCDIHELVSIGRHASIRQTNA